MNSAAVSIDQLRKNEESALIDCCESSWEPPYVVRYLKAKERREEAEAQMANRN